MDDSHEVCRESKQLGGPPGKKIKTHHALQLPFDFSERTEGADCVLAFSSHRRFIPAHFSGICWEERVADSISVIPFKSK